MLFLGRILALSGLLCLSVHADNFQVNVYDGGAGACDSGDLVEVLEGPYVAHAAACFSSGGDSFWIVNSGQFTLYSMRRRFA